MRRLALTAVLALAGSAAASYTSPRLVVAVQGAGMRIGVVVANTDDSTVRAAIYVPNGYTLSTPAAGTNLGDVTATVAAADLGGAILPLTGELDAVDPNSLTPAQRQGIAQCLTGAGAAAQTWLLHLTAAGQVLDLPLLVVPAAAQEQAAGYEAKLVVCLPPSDVPSGTPGRSPFGAKLLSATFGVSAIAPPATTGDSRWTSTFTPYNPGVGTVNAAGTVEAQSIVHLPARLAIKYTKRRVVASTLVDGKRKKIVSTTVTYSTAVTEAGRPGGGAVTATAGGKRVGGARGSFTFNGRATTLTATAELHKSRAVPTGTAPSSADLYFSDLATGACVKTPIFAGVPCVGATVGRATPRASARITGFVK